jgi:hypothetical protein
MIGLTLMRKRGESEAGRSNRKGLTEAERRERFVKTAEAIGVPDDEAAFEAAFERVVTRDAKSRKKD